MKITREHFQITLPFIQPFALSVDKLGNSSTGTVASNFAPFSLHGQFFICLYGTLLFQSRLFGLTTDFSRHRALTVGR